MNPQRKTALGSVAAAGALVVLKLTVGLSAGSLGLVSEAVHSGTDLVAALLTFFALGVAVRPADVSHPYGHGKAEHLAALAEAAFLAAASVLIGVRALERLFGSRPSNVQTPWYVFATIGVVILVDASRTVMSRRMSRRTGSPALASNAVHFASDLAGSIVVLFGLLLVRAGHPNGDALAALFVAVLVLVAAARLMRRNVDVLMDRAPADAAEAARTAIAALGPSVELRRLRMRQAAGRQFADVVIGVPPTSPVGEGHAVADAVEEAVQRALPGSDVVVHVEPSDGSDPRERAYAAAAAVPGVREIHNLSLVDVGGHNELSLHVKLPGEMSLAEAHDVAEQLEAAILAAVPSVDSVQTHLEPLTVDLAGQEVIGDTAAVEKIVSEVTGSGPRELRFLRTDAGVVAYLTLGLDGATSLDAAHARASEIEARIRVEAPEIADVVVHTEPAAQRPVRQRRTSGGGFGGTGRFPRRAAMKLCMFSPKGVDLERGWPGKIVGDQIVQLAAQTLQAFFTGGGGAREHATYELAECDLRAPVLYPPAIRLFSPFKSGATPFFSFVSPHPVLGPEDALPHPAGTEELDYRIGVTAVIGAEGAIGGFTLANVWTARDLARAEREAGHGPAKSGDFGISLGPVVVTPDELAGEWVVARVNGEERTRADFRSLDHPWAELVEHASRNTSLRPGDLLVALAAEGSGKPLRPGDLVEIEGDRIGVLRNRVA